MLKIYSFCLSNVLIIDKYNNTMFSVYAGIIKKEGSEAIARVKAQRITTATINKHINNYGKFVVGIPILNEFAPEHLYSFDENKDYIGSFPYWSAAQKFFVELEEASKPFFDLYYSCNKWADIIELFAKVKRGLSVYEKEHIEEHLADENSSFHRDVKREKALFDLLNAAPHLLAAS